MFFDFQQLNPGELVTNDILTRIVINSVRIYKLDQQNYEIYFAKTGSYEEFSVSQMN